MSKADSTALDNRNTPNCNDIGRLNDNDNIDKDGIDDDRFSDNEMVPIYNTHCVLINDDDDDDETISDGCRGLEGRNVARPTDHRH